MKKGTKLKIKCKKCRGSGKDTATYPKPREGVVGFSFQDLENMHTYEVKCGSCAGKGYDVLEIVGIEESDDIQ